VKYSWDPGPDRGNQRGPEPRVPRRGRPVVLADPSPRQPRVIPGAKIESAPEASRTLGSVATTWAGRTASGSIPFTVERSMRRGDRMPSAVGVLLAGAVAVTCPCRAGASVTWHPSGQVASVTCGTGVTTAVVHDGRARTSAVTADGVLGLENGYDGADNVRSYEDRAVAGSLRAMTYDPLDRLETAVAAGRWGTRSYSYDALGNRRSRGGGQVASYTYDDQNRLSLVTGASGLAPMRLAWSETGRLAATSDGASYRYDGHGRRVEKAEGSGRTVYHHDAAGRVIAETAPDGTGIREYYYLGNRLLAVKGCVSGAGCGEVEWYHTDALGSVVARTGGSGAVVMARLEYEPWGERWTSSGVAGDRQYNGRVYDPGTGFHDYGARLYWPEIGRFVSADSVMGEPGSPASLNRYSYVLDNPYKFTDPSGHNPLLVGALIALLFIENDQNANLAPAAAAVAPAAAAGVSIAAGAMDLAQGNYKQAEQDFGAALLLGLGAKAAGSSAAASRNSALQRQAVAARDALASELAEQAHPPATVVGAYSPSTGQVTAGASRGGGLGCAEGVCSQKLGSAADIKFTKAVRPRTGQTVPVCQNCEKTYGRGAFPADAAFKSDQVR